MRLNEKELLDHSLLLEQLVDAGYCGEGIKIIASTFLTSVNYGVGLEVLEIFNPELDSIIKSYYDLALVEANDEPTYLDEAVIMSFVDLTVGLEVKTLMVVDALKEEKDAALSKSMLVAGTQTISYIMASGLANQTAVDLVKEGADLYVNLIQAHPDEIVGTNRAVSRELFRSSATATISELRTKLVIPHLVKAFRILMSDLTYRIKDLPYVTELPNVGITIKADDSEEVKSFLRAYAGLVFDTLNEEEEGEEDAEEQAHLAAQAIADREARRLERRRLAEEEELRKAAQEDKELQELLARDAEEEALTSEQVEEEEYTPSEDASDLTTDEEEVAKSQEELDEVIDKYDAMPDASNFGPQNK